MRREVQKSENKQTTKLNGTKSTEGENDDSTKSCGKIDNQDGKIAFKYNIGSAILEFELISDKRFICPKCKKDFKNILRHLQQSVCRIPNLEDLSQQFQDFKKKQFGDKIKQRQNEKKAKSRAKQREEDEHKFKNIEKERKSKFNAKKREEDELQLKTDQNKWKVKSINKQRKEDELQLKADQNKRRKKIHC